MSLQSECEGARGGGLVGITTPGLGMRREAARGGPQWR